MTTLTKRYILAALALLFCFLPTAGAMAQCTPEVNNIIARFMKGASAEDRARFRQAFDSLQKVRPSALEAFQNVILTDLKNAPVDEVSGVANPKHWVRAASGWTSDPGLLTRYLEAVDFFRDGTTLKRGLVLQATTPKSTTNVRRVAGGAGSKAEAWELVSAREMVEREYFTKAEVKEFGRKIALTSGGEVEADVWVEFADGKTKWLVDQKHTLAPETDRISAITDNLIRRWIAGLQNQNFQKVLIPTNAEVSPTLVARIETLLLEGGRPLDEIQFVTDLSPF